MPSLKGSLLRSLALLVPFTQVVTAIRHYDIINNCPLPITLYINGESQGTLTSSGGSTTRDLPDGWSGFIYTDFNQGNEDGTATVRAGFYGTVSPLPPRLKRCEQVLMPVPGQLLLHRQG